MENREQPKVSAVVLVPQKERGKEDNNIFYGNKGLEERFSDLSTGESLEILVNDFGDIEFSQLSQEEQQQLNNNLNRRPTSRALQVRQQRKEQSNKNMRSNIDNEMSK